jgi:protein associated with RNAse G/E
MITIQKKDEAGQVTWEYHGEVLKRGTDFVTLEARFNREDTPFQGIVLKQNDRFVETFYTERWYNIFEIHDREDGSLKGWYCNVARPAVWETAEVLSYVDLALDLWVSAEGQQVVLDEDEFEALKLEASLRQRALEALEELRAVFNAEQPPV